MALIFPNLPTDGQEWVDGCGHAWYYNADNNSWYKPVDPSDIPDVSPFVRDGATGEISPRTSGDYLDMEPGRIDISQYPLT